MPPKQKLTLGNDGLQPFKAGRQHPAQIHAILQASVQNQRFRAVLDPETGFCSMQCRSCKVHLSPANQHGTAAQHLKSCKGAQDTDAAQAVELCSEGSTSDADR